MRRQLDGKDHLLLLVGGPCNGEPVSELEYGLLVEVVVVRYDGTTLTPRLHC